MSLPAVMVNFDAYKPLQHRHQWLMMTLASFSDRQGRCWPSLRTIAQKAGRSLAWVSENLKEMHSLGYFKRSRKAGAYFYEIARRFLPWRQESAGADSSKPGRQPRRELNNSQSCAQPGVRAGEPKENPRRSLFSKKEKGDSGRSAPLPPPPTEADKEAVAELVREATASLTGKGPKFIRDREAYELAKARHKYQAFLRGLAAWIAQRWAPGETRWEAEAMINQGLEAGRREQTPPTALGFINRLAELRKRERGRG